MKLQQKLKPKLTVSVDNIEIVLSQLSILFPKNIVDKINPIFDGYESCLENRDKFKDSLLFVNDLFSIVNTLNDNKFKLNHFLAWYYIYNVLEAKKEINLNEETVNGIIRYIRKKYLSITTLDTPFRDKEKEMICSRLDSMDSAIFYYIAYSTRYESWVLLMDVVFEILKERKIII